MCRVTGLTQSGSSALAFRVDLRVLDLVGVPASACDLDWNRARLDSFEGVPREGSARSSGS